MAFLHVDYQHASSQNDDLKLHSGNAAETPQDLLVIALISIAFQQNSERHHILNTDGHQDTLGKNSPHLSPAQNMIKLLNSS